MDQPWVKPTKSDEERQRACGLLPQSTESYLAKVPKCSDKMTVQTVSYENPKMIAGNLQDVGCIKMLVVLRCWFY